MLLPEELYAPSLRKRWNNTREWIRERCLPQGGPLVKIADGLFAEAESHWPPFCFGSANSWLLIVGPSPGKSEPKKSISASEYKKLKYSLWLGASHPGFTFRDGSNYFKHVTELFVDNFFRALNLDAHVGRALTHHANLLKEKAVPQPDRGQLSGADAMKGIKYIFQETHPHCIIANTQYVFEVLQSRRFCEHQVTKSGELDFRTARRVYHPRWELWELKNKDKILYARTPNQPVRHGFWLLPEFATTLAKIAKEELNMEC